MTRTDEASKRVAVFLLIVAVVIVVLVRRTM